MIRELLRHVREYKRDSLLTPLLVILEVGMEVAIPFFLASLIDGGINKGDMGHVLSVGGLLVILALISLVFGSLASGTVAKAASGFAANLRKDMFYKVQDLSFSNIDKFSTASIITRITTDVNNVQNAYQMLIRIAVRAPAMMIFSLFMAFSIDSNLSMIFLMTMPILAISLLCIIGMAHPVFKRVFRTYDTLNNVVQENIRGIRVVKSFVREEHEKDKFSDVSKKIHDDFCIAEKILAFNMPIMQACVYACILLISWFGASSILSLTMTTGELMSLISYNMLIMISLMILSMVFVMIVISKASAERIVELLGEVSDIRNPENPAYEIPDGTISFKDVSFGYAKGKDCLKDIGIEIKEGEMIGVIGGTGSSKTSLVQLIPRLYDVREGVVSVGGKDVRDYDITSLRNAVAMVLQKNILFSGTIKENLRWGSHDATDEEMEKACRAAQAHGFITSFPDGYDTVIEQGGANLSGGQRQRLCIARALLKKPKILILDDSTSAVDVETEARIRKSFREDIPDVTTIIIAQRISSVEDADRIIVLDNGKIEAIGRHEELLSKSPIYSEVYNSQKKGNERFTDEQ